MATLQEIQTAYAKMGRTNIDSDGLSYWLSQPVSVLNSTVDSIIAGTAAGAAQAKSNAAAVDPGYAAANTTVTPAANVSSGLSSVVPITTLTPTPTPTPAPTPAPTQAPQTPQQYIDSIKTKVPQAPGEYAGLTDTTQYELAMQKLNQKGGSYATAIQKWNNLDPTIDPGWGYAFTEMNDYFKEGQMAPGSKWIKTPDAAVRLLDSFTQQRAQDAAPSAFDAFLNKAVPLAILTAAGWGIANMGPVQGLTATETTQLAALPPAQQTAAISAIESGAAPATTLTNAANGINLGTATSLGGSGSGALAAEAITNAGGAAALDSGTLAKIISAAGLNGATLDSVAKAVGISSIATTAVKAVTGAGAGTGSTNAVTSLLNGLGITGTTADTIGTLLSKVLPGLVPLLAASNASSVNPNIFAGNNSVVTGSDGSVVTLDPEINASRMYGLGVNNVLMGESAKALSDLTPNFDSYIKNNTSNSAAAGTALKNYQTSMAPVTAALDQAGTDLTGLETTAKGNKTTFDTAVAGANTGFNALANQNQSNLSGYTSALSTLQGNLAPLTGKANDNLSAFGATAGGINNDYSALYGASGSNLGTFKNALAPVNATLGKTGTEFQSLYDAAGTNKGGYVQSVVNPVIQANDIQYGSTVQDFGNRGLSGSSFAADALGNQTRLGAQRVSDATASATQQSLGLQQGLASSQVANAQAQLSAAQSEYDAGNKTIEQQRIIDQAKADLAKAQFDAGTSNINTIEGITQAQAGLAGAGFAAGDTSIKTGAGLTNDALMASQAGFNAGTATINQVASLVAQNAQVASYKAQLIQQGFTDEQANITIQQALNQGNLTAAIQRAAATDASVSTRAGLESANQGITNNIASTGLNTLRMGSDTNTQSIGNANTSNALWGSALGATSNALTGTGYSTTPTKAKTSATAFWNGYDWVG